MTIKELKDKIVDIPDTFVVLVYNGKTFKEIENTSTIFSHPPKDCGKFVGSFNLETGK